MACNQEQISACLEIEFKYFIDLNANLLLKEQIRQASPTCLVNYLYDQTTTEEILSKFFNDSNIYSYLPASQKDFKGRIRSKSQDNKTVYSFDLKGPKDASFAALGLVAKPEISIPLSKILFEQIASSYPLNYLKKNRVTFSILLDNLPDKSLKAEFDIYTQINQLEVSPKFAVLEIEIPESDNPEQIIAEIRKSNATITINDQTVRLDEMNCRELLANEGSLLSQLISGRKIVKIIKNSIPAEFQSYFN